MGKRLSRSSKWAKTRVMLKNETLHRHTPETRLLTHDNLLLMLNKYHMVYVKPCFGSRGRGVMRVELLGSGSGSTLYRFQSGSRRYTFGSYSEAYRALVRTKDRAGESYLVQQGVHLLKYKGRPFDIRIMVQRNRGGTFEVTGWLGRAAHPHKIVTNGSQGGTIYSVEHLLKNCGVPRPLHAIQEEMKQLGLIAIRQLSQAYAGMHEIGLDVGIDRDGKSWILEANTRPDVCPFTLLRDKGMLRRIVYLGRAYGRRYNLVVRKARRGGV